MPINKYELCSASISRFISKNHKKNCDQCPPNTPHEVVLSLKLFPLCNVTIYLDLSEIKNTLDSTMRKGSHDHVLV